jgi:uncharacterized protein (DUF433 family)
MDWSGCELVEVIEGKVSGKPLVKGTRIPADIVRKYVDRGAPLEQVLEDYPSLSMDTVRRLAIPRAQADEGLEQLASLAQSRNGLLHEVIDKRGRHFPTAGEDAA